MDGAGTSRRRAALLALLAAYVDAHALITYGAFVSFMSGNSTLAGGALGRGLLARALPPGVAIAGFVLGGFGGTLLAAVDASSRRALAIVAALLVAVLVLVHVGAGPITLVALMSISMGVLDALVTHVGAESLHVAFVTGTLSAMARHLALALRGEPGHLRRARLLLGVWCAFLFGAVLGGAATAWVGSWTLVAPVVVLSGLVAVG